MPKISRSDVITQNLHNEHTTRNTSVQKCLSHNVLQQIFLAQGKLGVRVRWMFQQMRNSSRSCSLPHAFLFFWKRSDQRGVVHSPPRVNFDCTPKVPVTQLYAILQQHWTLTLTAPQERKTSRLAGKPTNSFHVFLQPTSNNISTQHRCHSRIDETACLILATKRTFHKLWSKIKKWWVRRPWQHLKANLGGEKKKVALLVLLTSHVQSAVSLNLPVPAGQCKSVASMKNSIKRISRLGHSPIYIQCSQSSCTLHLPFFFVTMCIHNTSSMCLQRN